MDARDFPALTHLARAYFHQDFRHEYPDGPEAAVTDFLDGETEQAALLVAEIDRALGTLGDDAAAERFWLDTLDGSYITTHDGIGGRAWLEHLRDRARGSAGSAG